jgi:hypothetical protein
MHTSPVIRLVDMPILDEIFEMHGGYVLDFTNATFQSFFASEIGVDIGSEIYSARGTSKAKRLKCFLLQADRVLALKALTALWEYRTASKLKDGSDDLLPPLQDAFFAILTRLGGKKTASDPRASPIAEQVNPATYGKLSLAFKSLLELSPHPRGFAFEKFLNDLFTAFQLVPRPSFRLRGEQIDGSFSHAGQTYLLEAKWTNSQADAAALRAFNAKVEDKAKWSRGLFVSYSGFTLDGLHAFGKGKSVICMDGLDLHDVLERQIDFVRVIDIKARAAAETGLPFSPVRDIVLRNRE